MTQGIPADERWAVEDDDRPGMEYNRHIVIEAHRHLRVAFMSHGAGRAIDAARARLAASAPALLAALEGLIEDAQPDNWDDEDDPGMATAWRNAMRVMCEARGLAVPTYLTDEAD